MDLAVRFKIGARAKRGWGLGGRGSGGQGWAELEWGGVGAAPQSCAPWATPWWGVQPYLVKVVSADVLRTCHTCVARGVSRGVAMGVADLSFCMVPCHFHR